VYAVAFSPDGRVLVSGSADTPTLRRNGEPSRRERKMSKKWLDGMRSKKSFTFANLPRLESHAE
jgi:hypothetical protein